MKGNFLKYIFILFAIGIVSYAIYTFYIKEENNEIQQETTQTIETIYKITDLRLGVSNFDTINPLITNNKEVLNIDKLIFEPLITITQDYKTELTLAQECSKISDTTYIIKVDNSVKWHNETFFTAKDVAFTIDRLKEGRSVYSYNVEKIANTEIVDASTIKINLTEPVDFFEYYLTFPILPNDYYLNEDFYVSTKTPIGTGMFSIYEITPTNIKLTKNENWWNKEEITLDTINIKICQEIGELYNSFKMGNIDLYTTQNMNIENYIGTIGYEKQSVKGRELDYIAFNCQNNVLKYQEVRKAINYAIDKANIISSVYNNEYFTADYPLDYGSYLYNKETLSSGYNQEQAKQVLTEAGWEYTNGRWQKRVGNSTVRLNLTLTVNSNNENRVQVAENIKQQLSQVGINVTINKVSESRYQTILENKSYEMLLTGVYNSYSPDLTNFFGANNLQNYNNEEINTILTEIKNIEDEKLLEEKYNKILQIYNDEQPFLCLYRNKINIVRDQSAIGEIKANSFFSYYGLNNWYRI